MSRVSGTRWALHSHLPWLVIAVLVITPSIQTIHFPDIKQAEYVRSLDSYHVIHPAAVTHDGHHLTHDLHPHVIHRKRRSTNLDRDLDPTLHYHIPLPGDNNVTVRVSPNQHLISPGISVERWKNVYGNLSDVRLFHLAQDKVDCFYRDRVKGNRRSKVALSVCNGLRGFFHSDGEEYLIEPVKGGERGEDGRHPHVVYKRSALARDLGGQLRQEGQGKEVQGHTCGVTDDEDSALERSNRKKREAEQPKMRSKRSVSSEKYIETLVVVDPAMMEHYRDDDVETYVLTIMNMVSTVFHDASIGNSLNIVIVRLLLLEEDQDQLKISHHADNSLGSFCRWQKMINPKGDDHANHHDTAILLTRYNICSRMNQPCSTLGLAQVSGMCQQHRSCSINEDTGLALAYTVSHELGHNFGLKHDGVHNHCKTSGGHTQHVMSPHLIADSSPLVWSSCSRLALTNFLDRDWGHCLDDAPTLSRFTYPVVPPGTMYDADHQCRLTYGPDAELCDGIENICSTLWCRVNNKCLTKLEAAAEGTLCAENKWCFAGNCTLISDRPEAVDGQWGEWGGWMTCSRTCGAGVSLKERHCVNPRPANGGKYCLGERKRYRICNTMDCDEGKPTFREAQCSKLNGKRFKNHLYTWEPVLSPTNPCQLNCKPVNRYFSVMARDTVIDGTPCRHGSKDMCISGRCRRIGCDWQIDSKATEDRCGVCHGDATACKMVKQKFNKKNGHGYVEATVIPKGARNIRVEEVAAANNYLALRNNQGHYYLNGNWFIQWSGDYSVAGTTVRYTRFHNKESFVAAGPLKEQLHLMLLFQTDNPGVSFEYTVPTDNHTRTIRPHFTWAYTDWSHCSASCGAGSQRSEVMCVENEAGPVDERYCDPTTKLDDRQRACNTHECPARWWVGPWQHCSVTCGDDGFHHRTVICVRGVGVGEQIALDDAKCAGLRKYVQVKPCRAREPCPPKGQWIIGAWVQECKGNPCMKQWRSVTCSDPISGCDLDLRPSSIQQCSTVTCGQWMTSIWTKCSVTCGGGAQYRNVFCDHKPCDRDNEPQTQRPCHLNSCPTTRRTTRITTSTTRRTTPTTTTSTTSIKSTSKARLVYSSFKLTTLRYTTKRVKPFTKSAMELTKYPKSTTKRAKLKDSPSSVQQHAIAIERVPQNSIFLTTMKPARKSEHLATKTSKTSVSPSVLDKHIETLVKPDIKSVSEVEKSTDRKDTTNIPKGDVTTKIANKYQYLTNLYESSKNSDNFAIEDNIITESTLIGVASKGTSQSDVDINSSVNIARDKAKITQKNMITSNVRESTNININSAISGESDVIKLIDNNVNISKNIKHNINISPDVHDTITLKHINNVHTNNVSDARNSFDYSKRGKMRPNSEKFPSEVSKNKIISKISPKNTKDIDDTTAYILNIKEARPTIHTKPNNVKIKTNINSVQDTNTNSESKDSISQEDHIKLQPVNMLETEHMPYNIPEGGSELNKIVSSTRTKSDIQNTTIPHAEEQNFIEPQRNVKNTFKITNVRIEGSEVNSHKDVSIGATTHTIVGSLDGGEVAESEYMWAPLPWEKCSNGCGNGTRSRSIVCTHRQTRKDADDANCASISQPITEERCSAVNECLAWVATDWLPCTPQCSPSVKTRSVYCPVGGSCDAAIKPSEKETCNMTQPCLTWIAGEWSMCSKSCGTGEQQRMVQCVNLLSQQSTTNCDIKTRPLRERECNTDKCLQENAALSQKCEYNKMGYKICEVLHSMKQCTKPFVQRNCCKSCGIEQFNMYRNVKNGKRRHNRHRKNHKHKGRGRKVVQ